MPTVQGTCIFIACPRVPLTVYKVSPRVYRPRDWTLFFLTFKRYILINEGRLYSQKSTILVARIQILQLIIPVDIKEWSPHQVIFTFGPESNWLNWTWILHYAIVLKYVTDQNRAVGTSTQRREHCTITKSFFVRIKYKIQYITWGINGGLNNYLSQPSTTESIIK